MLERIGMQEARVHKQLLEPARLQRQRSQLPARFGARFRVGSSRGQPHAPERADGGQKVRARPAATRLGWREGRVPRGTVTKLRSVNSALSESSAPHASTFFASAPPPYLVRHPSPGDCAPPRHLASSTVGSRTPCRMGRTTARRVHGATSLHSPRSFGLGAAAIPDRPPPCTPCADGCRHLGAHANGAHARMQPVKNACDARANRMRCVARSATAGGPIECAGGMQQRECRPKAAQRQHATWSLQRTTCMQRGACSVRRACNRRQR
jgi:hypothetical protein